MSNDPLSEDLARDRPILSFTLNPRDLLMEIPPEQKRTWVIALMIKCPMGTPLQDCPADQVRGLPLDNILKRVNEMTDAEIDRFIDHHQQCLWRREGIQINAK